MSNSIRPLSGKRSKGRKPKPQSNQQAVSKYAGDAYSLAVRTAQGLNAVRRLINIEVKDFNNTLGIQPSSTWTFINFSPIAQGLTDGARVGNSIKLQSLFFAAYIELYPGVTTDNAVRFMLLRDHENAGAAPTSAIFQYPAALYQLTTPLTSIAEKRFTVVFDETVNIACNGDKSAFFKYSSSANQHIKFRGTDATDASAAEGSLWFATCADNNAVNSPAIYGTWRLRYTDD
jgi:hypothetical protein